MTGAKEFEAFLAEAAGPYPRLRAAADALRAIASAAIELSNLIGLGRLYGQLGAARGSTNIDGDVQKELDILANDMFVRALRQAPVGAVVSEEIRDPLVLNPAGKVAIAMDPLDGSSNIDTNLSIGTIFSIFPRPDAAELTCCNRGGRNSPRALSFTGRKRRLCLRLGKAGLRSSR